MNETRIPKWPLGIAIVLCLLIIASSILRPWIARLDPSKPIAHFTGQWAYDHCEEMAAKANSQGARQWTCEAIRG